MDLILKLWAIIKDDFIAFVALILSGISIVFTFFEHLKKKANLVMKVDQYKSFYIDAIYTPRGNQESLVLNVELSNRSESPIEIMDIKLKEFDTSLCNYKEIDYDNTDLPSEPYSVIKDANGNLDIIAHTGDGYECMCIQNNLITCPIRLEAYGGIKGVLLFIEAGSSSGKFKKVELELITSRGKIRRKCKVYSKKYNESFFN